MRVWRCFTHVDPFEDTERAAGRRSSPARTPVSPTSIRSRILKVIEPNLPRLHEQAVSPTSIRSRILKGVRAGFERIPAHGVSPTSIRSRILKGACNAGFAEAGADEFHPRRSVRGY